MTSTISLKTILKMMTKKNEIDDDQKTTRTAETIDAKPAESATCHIQPFTLTLRQNTTQMAHQEGEEAGPRRTLGI